MIDQNEFLKKYNISEENFDSTGLKWPELIEIFEDFSSIRDDLQENAVFLINQLVRCKNIHSVRYRVKDPEHLVDKIIRKKLLDPARVIDLKNYKDQFDDLIGLRALHLFKSDWPPIHEYVLNKFDVPQQAVANYRKGDSEEYLAYFTEKGLKTKEHKYGYRSVHYTIKTRPGKEEYNAELQVRTIFEEGWSEIDHSVRYPNSMDNKFLLEYSMILNRISGAADEMGSFLQGIKNDIEEKNQVVRSLEQQIAALNLEANQVAQLKKEVDRLKKYEPGIYIDPPPNDYFNYGMHPIGVPHLFDNLILDGTSHQNPHLHNADQNIIFQAPVNIEPTNLNLTDND